MVGIPVDLKDDYYSEALQIYLRNSWLNYAGYHSTGMSRGYYYYVLYMFLLSVFSRCLYPCCSCFCSRCKISFREIGIRVEVLDTLDERALTMAEIYELCSFCLVPMARRRKASQTHIGVDVVPTRGVGNGGAWEATVESNNETVWAVDQYPDASYVLRGTSGLQSSTTITVPTTANSTNWRTEERIVNH